MPTFATLCSCIALSMAIYAPACPAAEITLDKDGAGSVVRLSGTITPGDADKLLALVKAHRWRASRLSLDSHGGNVLESLKLAQIVQKTAMFTEVRPDHVCASACFFVFLGGYLRYASGSEYMAAPERRAAVATSTGVMPKGYVGVHRPFEPALGSPENSQLVLMRAVVDYLDRQLIPRRITDAMMSRPSNDIYWLSSEDLDDIGEHPPQIEEYLIQRCNYDRNRSKRMAAAIESGKAAEYQELNSADAKASQCLTDERAKLHEAGLKQIQAGWRPKAP